MNNQNGTRNSLRFSLASIIMIAGVLVLFAQQSLRNQTHTRFDSLQVTNEYSPGVNTNAFVAASNNVFSVSHRAYAFNVITGRVNVTAENTNSYGIAYTNFTLVTNLVLQIRNGVIVGIGSP